MITPELLSIVIWPLIVLIALLFFFLIFKRSISQAIERLQKTKLPGGTEAEFSPGRSFQEQSDIGKKSEAINKVVDEKLIQQEVTIQEQETNILQEKDDITWVQSYIEGNYRKARELIDEEIKSINDREKLLVLNTIATDIKSYYDFEEAKNEYKALINEFPSEMSLYIYYSGIYRRNHLYNEALSVLDQGVERIRNSSALKLQKINILKEQQKYKETQEAINEFLANTKDDTLSTSKALCIQGDIYDKQGNQELAQNSFIQAYRKAPTSSEIIHRIATYFYEKNDFKVESFFRKHLVQLEPNNSTNWVLLGNCYLSLHLNNLAMDAYDKGNELTAEKEGWIIANIGNLYKNVGLYTRAIKHLSRAIELDATSQYAHERLSQSYIMKTNEEKKANEILESAREQIEIIPKIVEATKSEIE